VVRRLFTEIAPRLNGHRGGYTRVLRLRRRTGDNAELALLELTRLAPIASPTGKAKSAAAAKPATPEGQPSPKAGRGRAAPVDQPERPSKSKVEAAAPSEPPAAPDSEEQPSPPPKKGFMDGLRKFFKK
jgi:large subunit ribosomal protein L17